LSPNARLASSTIDSLSYAPGDQGLTGPGEYFYLLHLRTSGTIQAPVRKWTGRARREPTGHDFLSDDSGDRRISLQGTTTRPRCRGIDDLRKSTLPPASAASSRLSPDLASSFWAGVICYRGVPWAGGGPSRDVAGHAGEQSSERVCPINTTSEFTTGAGTSSRSR
jgi:hypothetical protein